MGQDRTKTVLIVEDDRLLRTCLIELLQAEGYSVCEASDGQQGLDMLRERSLPDIILLDMMMPVKDGAAFRLEQCQDPRLEKIPTFVLSADAYAGERAQLFKACAHLPKPFNIARLLRAVERKVG